MRELSGKVAIVTGGARGIGLTYAERLASLGANIAVCDLNLKSAEQYPLEAERLVDGSLEKTLRKYGCDVHLGEFDACDPDAVQTYAAAVHARWGRIDVLVCNAGGGSDTEGSHASVIKPESMRKAFDRNFFSTVYSCTAVAPYMKTQRAGCRQAGRSPPGGWVWSESHCQRVELGRYRCPRSARQGKAGVCTSCLSLFICLQRALKPRSIVKKIKIFLNLVEVTLNAV